MKQYVIFLIAILFTGGIVYGLSKETEDEFIERINREEQKKFIKEQRDCLAKATATGTSSEISQKLNECQLRQIPKLKTISGNSNGNSGKILNGTVTPASTGVPGGSQNQTVSLECEWGQIEKVEGIEFHYTATDSDTTLQAIKNGHTARGSEHIGYHYVIKPDGEITNTRDEKCVAAADKWHKNNYRFIQVAFVGDDKPTKEQGESMAKLAKDIQKRYNLPIDSVSAHADWGPKSKKESLEHWFGSKEQFIKMIRYYYVISIYGKGSEELQYMWRAWGDLDFIATIFQESRFNNNAVGDGGNSIGYCQIHGQLQPGWQRHYKSLKTMQERLNYCHELYIYAKGLKGGVGSRFHGFNARHEHLKNISIE